MSGLSSNEEAWQTAMRNDPRSTQDLISLALSALDEEAAWRPVQVLHYRANREVLDTVRCLSSSSCSSERELAANILGQFGVPKRVYPEEAVAELLTMLEREQDGTVLAAIAVALGHQHSPRSVGPLTRLRCHADPEVRWSVAYALAGQDDARALEALIELSADTDGDVRDWATFALGSQTEVDTPELREALVRRLNDSHEDAQGEALVGLASRGDSRAFEFILRELMGERPRRFAIEAASLLGDSRLCPHLLALRGEDEESDRLLQEAIERCQGKSS